MQSFSDFTRNGGRRPDDVSKPCVKLSKLTGLPETVRSSYRDAEFLILLQKEGGRGDLDDALAAAYWQAKKLPEIRSSGLGWKRIRFPR
ncbi:hypothetical protein AVEN_137008-1 [Araneus ventricosus]|uniref:Uncharacterized protein n=1 Tax=Araneus ventricosus TaxID=182803 RepID=A0A4Y2R7A6_ARAVE|nr:hypothetical protein AVEN_137008-1 [Araneus ventricosus]